MEEIKFLIYFREGGREQAKYVYARSRPEAIRKLKIALGHSGFLVSSVKTELILGLWV